MIWIVHHKFQKQGQGTWCIPCWNISSAISWWRRPSIQMMTSLEWKIIELSQNSRWALLICITFMVSQHWFKSCHRMGAMQWHWWPSYSLISSYVKQSWPEPPVNRNAVFPSMGIFIVKIWWSHDRLIFIMGIPILVRRQYYIETPPVFWHILIRATGLV